MHVAQHWAGDMPQPTRYTMTFDRRTHRLGDDQPDARALHLVALTSPPDMNDDVGLHGTHSVPHRRVKLS
jgi:hypothetical protein